MLSISDNESSGVSVMKGYQNFGSLIDGTISYRMYGKAVDIDMPKERYVARIEEFLPC